MDIYLARRQTDTMYKAGRAVGRRQEAGPAACQAWCRLSRRCSHFSYSQSSRTCYLVAGAAASPQPGVVSGPRQCGAQLQCRGQLCLAGGKPGAGNVLLAGRPVRR